MASLCALFFLAMSLAPASASELTQGSPCSLIEGLPGPKAPIRGLWSMRGILKAIDNPKATPAQMSKRFDQLEKLLHKALAEAEKIFHDKPRREWVARDQKKARKYLEKHVLGKSPLLQIGEVGLEPRQGLRAAMMYAACRAQRPNDAMIAGGKMFTGEEHAALIRMFNEGTAAEIKADGGFNNARTNEIIARQ